jgi:hypothetical protein
LKYENSRPEKQLSYEEINLDSLKKKLMLGKKLGLCHRK